MSESTKAFDDFDALGLIDILPANGRAVIGAAWVICWHASRTKALEDAEKAIVAADGCGEPLVLALASVRALKEQA